MGWLIMTEDKTPKGTSGTSWKRRRVAALAGVALTALTALGAASMTGNAQAGTGWGGLRSAPPTQLIGPAPVAKPIVAPAPVSGGDIETSAASGWGG
jgi:hypothetical protein